MPDGSTTFRLGLTGTIGSGKSTVGRWLAEHGALVIDSDRLAREVVAPDTPGLAAVTNRFGSAMLTADGQLDRERLAQRVFADPAALADLEAILHPLVAQRREALVAELQPPLVVVEAVKLIEAGHHRSCDLVWLVTAPEALRRDRLVQQRGMTAADADRRLAAQPETPDRLATADLIITNDGELSALHEQLRAAWEQSVPKAVRRRLAAVG